MRLGSTRRAVVGLHASGRGGVPGRLARFTAAVLAVMAAVLLVSGEARAQTETEHWSATLTCANGVAASSDNHGYVAATETGPGGVLAPPTFTYDNVPYPVKRLYVTDTGFIDLVSFETYPALPNDAGLVLRVPTFKTDDVFTAGCPAVVEYQDFEIYSPDSSRNPGWFSWGVSLTSCLTNENWAADLTTTGTVKLIGPTDNDTTTPTVTLALSDDSIGENGGVSTVTATTSSLATGLAMTRESRVSGCAVAVEDAARVRTAARPDAGRGASAHARVFP